jgi:hypothetical protein
MTTDALICPDDARRDLFRAAAAPGVVAIDHIEVLPSRRALVVHLFDTVPAGLGAEHVRIEGGERVRVRVVAAAPADALLPGQLGAADRAVVDALPVPSRSLVVRTAAPGDFSRYTLELVRPTGSAAVFDPILTRASFGFMVDCPTPFDCRDDEACEPEAEPPPRIDYLARDYASFRRLMLDRLTETVPDWTERNPVDFGIMVVEALAYAADEIAYLQDAAATEAYLGTARLRSSVRRHARLLDYALGEGCNARAWLALTVTAAADGITIPAGLRVLPSDIVLGPGPDALSDAVAGGAVVFETIEPTTPLQARNAIRFHTWGDPRCCLPRGATAATVVDDAGSPLGLAEGDVLILEELRGSSGRPVDADPAHRHAVRLSEPPIPVTDPLDGSRLLAIRWHSEDALPFPLRVGGSAGAPWAAAYGNVVLADHGLTVSDDPVVVPSGRRFRPELSRRGVTHRAPHDPVAARKHSARRATAVDPSAVLPAVRFDGEDEVWAPKRDLLGSDAFAPHLVVEMEEDGRALTRFGDGVQGRRPGDGERFRATYRVGSGPAGNVGAETLTKPITAPAGLSVRNPCAAVGGTRPEPLDQARLDAPQAFRRQERAVTEQDYAAAAERHPEVWRAAARRRWTGSWHTVFLTVDRRGGADVDAAFEAELRHHLARFRMAGEDLEIDAPSWVSLELELAICVAPGFIRADVEAALRDVFSSRPRRGGGLGLFHPDRLTFGQTVYLAPLVAAAMSLAGVHRADPVLFRRWREVDRGELAAGHMTMGALEIPRLDDDPSRPENGRLGLRMTGGL